jgi:hypothetical protein
MASVLSKTFYSITGGVTVEPDAHLLDGHSSRKSHGSSLDCGSYSMSGCLSGRENRQLPSGHSIILLGRTLGKFFARVFLRENRIAELRLGPPAHPVLPRLTMSPFPY